VVGFEGYLKQGGQGRDSRRLILFIDWGDANFGEQEERVYSSRFDLSGKVAIITGAGRGIGRRIAFGLAECGADVAICSRTKRELDEVAQEIAGMGRQVLTYVIDVRQLSEIGKLVKKTTGLFGHIDILVNNAAVVLIAPAVGVTESDWDLVMDTNVKGPFFLCQEVGKVMIKQGHGGSIINVTSEVAQKTDLLPLGAYGTSKSALHNVTKLLAREWGRYGIRVNSLAPCFVKTEMNAPLMATGDFYEEKLKRVPLGRCAEPDDLVGAAIFLASEASAYVSGTSVLVDGGYTA
jgi:NAD(P)-dependent dehydrogenase (short-subunit alcohol dehydrogenase family)